MATPRTLRQPPIREALIDLRVAADPAIDADTLSMLREKLSTEYPKVDEKKVFVTELRVDAGKLQEPATKDLGFGGLFFSNPEGTQIAQFRRDGFTVNRLSPYTGADAMIPKRSGCGGCIATS
jgi:uncharacterized protein (TIGR04255 family)